MKYYRLGDYYYAIDTENSRTYMCRITGPETEFTAQSCSGKSAKYVESELEANQVKEEITEPLFQEQFSKAVGWLEYDQQQLNYKTENS